MAHVSSEGRAPIRDGLILKILPPVRPTPEQLSILADDRPGFVVIRGAAGSGKTTTALLRLKHLSSFWLDRRKRLRIARPVRILVLTYNRTLEGYVAELARQQVESEPGLELRISTFGRWAREQLGSPSVLDDDEVRALVYPRCRNFSFDAEFLLNEVNYVLGRFRTEDLEQYIEVDRRGRGVAPRVDKAARRRILNEIIYPYLHEKMNRNLLDWHDVAKLVTVQQVLAPWDVVIVDEAQDFSANQARAVARHLADDFSATFVIDTTQRIYPRYFTWREVGINAPRIKKLSRNYRNTRQIAAFARPLVEGLPVEDDGALPDFNACDTDGPMPIVLEGRYSEQIAWVISHLKADVDLANESVAFLQPNGGGWFDDLRYRLQRAGLPYVDLQRRRSWPTGAEQIGLSTLASAKGLEFDHVVLPGFNQQVTPHGAEEGDAQLDAMRRLLAMGIGRARKSVYLGYKRDDRSKVLNFIDPQTYRFVRL